MCGAVGKMGSAVIKAVQDDKELQLVGAVDAQSLDADVGEIVGIGKVGVKINSSIDDLKDTDVIVDFTNPEVVENNVLEALDKGAHVVVGTTGLSNEQIANIEKRSKETGRNVFIAPNFAIGAVLMMELSKKAAKYMDSAEIIELHHDQKMDAPSGTALKTADGLDIKSSEIANEKETVKGSRGGLSEGIRIHSVRLPGLVAHQEVVFGAKGQTLTIRHDSIDRVSFMPGVVAAIKEVHNLPGVTIGLENIIKI